jgi:uncharacterized coiled-coil DUF342 family protein
LLVEQIVICYYLLSFIFLSCVILEPFLVCARNTIEMIHWAIFSSVIVSAITYLLGSASSRWLAGHGHGNWTTSHLTACEKVDRALSVVLTQNKDIAHTAHSLDFLQHVVSTASTPASMQMATYHISKDALDKVVEDTKLQFSAWNESASHLFEIQNVQQFYSTLFAVLDSLYSLDPHSSKIVVDSGVNSTHSGGSQQATVDGVFAESILRSTEIIDTLSRLTRYLDLHGQKFVGKTTDACVAQLALWNASVHGDLLSPEIQQEYVNTIASLKHDITVLVEEYNSNATSLNAQVEMLKNEHDSVRAQHEAVKAEHNTVKAEIAAVQSRLDNALTEITGTTTRMEALGGDLLTCKKDIDSQQTTHSQALAAKQQEIEKLQQRIKDLEVSIAGGNANTAAALATDRALIQEYESKQHELTQSVQTLTQSLEESKKQVGELALQVHSAEREKEEAMEALRVQAWSEITEARENLAHFQQETSQKVTELENAKRELEGNLQRASADCEFSSDQLRQMQQVVAELRKTSQSAGDVPESLSCPTNLAECSSTSAETQAQLSNCHSQMDNIRSENEMMMAECRLCFEHDNLCKESSEQLDRDLQFAIHSRDSCEEQMNICNERLVELDRLHVLAESKIDEIEQQRGHCETELDELRKEQEGGSSNGGRGGGARPTITPSGTNRAQQGHSSTQSQRPQQHKIPVHRTDYASRAAGGSIVKSQSSPTYVPTNITAENLLQMSVLGFFGRQNPFVGVYEDAINEDMKHGSCWPMQVRNQQLL